MSEPKPPTTQAEMTKKAAAMAAAHEARRPKYPEALAGRPRHPRRADKTAGSSDDRGDDDGDGDNDGAVRLILKSEVLEITGLSYPTIWAWMRAGRFPRARVLGGKSAWLSTDIEAWIDALPVRRLKGDDDVEAA